MVDTCFQRLVALSKLPGGLPSIEGRGKAYASSSEIKRQLENKAWTIRGFKVIDRRCNGYVEDLEPIEAVKPGPNDPFPDVLAELTLCKGSKSQRSYFFDEACSKALAYAVSPDEV